MLAAPVRKSNPARLPFVLRPFGTTLKNTAALRPGRAGWWAPASSSLRQPSRSVSTTWIEDAAWLNAVSPQLAGPLEQQRFQKRSERLRRGILAANWSDTLDFCLNVPFWESEYEKLHTMARTVPGILSNPEVAQEWLKLSTLLDVTFICEDLRDHLNELMEYLHRVTSREHGPKEAIVNLEEHIQAVLKRMALIREECPEYAPKLDESVGKGIKMMRQRVKFHWENEHEAFY